MATRNYVINPTNRGGRVTVATWSGLLAASNDVGQALELASLADRAVQVQGAVGTGGVVVIEGSLDGTNYVTLTDPQGDALSFDAIDQLRAIMEAVAYIRPRVTAGDGSTNFTVSILCRG